MINNINSYLDYQKKINDNVGTANYDNIIANYLIQYFNYSNETVLSDIKNLVLYYKENTNLSNKTINKCIKLLRQVYKFHKLESSDLFEFKLLKEKYTVKRVIPKEDLKKIFSYIDNINDKGNASTYRMLTYILYDTGVRPNELLNIKTKNINILERSIYLETTKTSVPRTIYMSKKITEKLKKYLKKYENEYLFYNDLKNRKISKEDLKNYWRRVKKATNIKELNSYMFRHTYITYLVDEDVPMVVTQNQVGHQRITTTMLYYHASTKNQKKHLYNLDR